MVKSINQSIN